MSTYTRRNPPGNAPSNIHTQAQYGVKPDRRADQLMFPSKPVAHRRPQNTKIQDSHNEFDFEKITITKQPRETLSQKHLSNGKETLKSQHLQRKDTQKLPRGELEMTKAIHEQQLMLHEKLRRLDAKVQQKIQRDLDSVAEGSDRGRTERGEAQSKTRLLEQRGREPVNSRGRREDVKQQMKRQDQQMEDRVRNEEKKAPWREETEYQRKGCQGTQKKKTRLENVRDHTRGKAGHEEGDRQKKEMRSTEITKRKEHSSTLPGDRGWSRERKHREMLESDDDRQLTPMSQHKTSHQAASQNYRDAGQKHSQKPLHPPGSGSSDSSRQEQEELSPTNKTSHSLQLIPCRVCRRKFARERLEKHVIICERVKHSKRPVFDTFASRTKGTSLGEYLKTHSRATTPEIIKKKKQRQQHGKHKQHP